ncbi:MAG TPA: alpha/beta hydrolase [Dehalococcoidia bacterium]|nr:alpha/beta hydrolase [Dehalococcoidia bacterium]
MLDPALFHPDAIDPETKAFNAQLEELLAQVPPTHTQTPQAVRRAREEGRGWRGPILRSEKAVERRIPGPAGDIPLRCFFPDRIDGVYLHFHGGGWVLGAADQQDQRLESLANACHVAVISVEYRLAPEHPYPAGPDDCEAAALWLAKSATSEFGTDRLVIAGESAGAHLAVVSLLRLRDRHGLRPFVAANLGYGVFDLRATPSLRNWGDRNLILNTPVMEWFFDHFVPPQKRDDPDVSPLCANLSSMPKALFTVGTLDPLLDDSLFMYARWLAAGNQAELAVYPGAVHGFTAFPIEIARRALAREDAFIRDAVAQAQSARA